MTRRRLVLAGVVTAMIVVLVLVGGPSAVEPTHAFVRFLEASGVDVRTASRPPAVPGTFVLFADARTADEERPLLDWVSSGGRLVVADPGSALAPSLGITTGERAGLVGETALPPACADPLAVGLGAVVVDAADETLRSSNARAVACFVRPGGSYAVVVRRGSGSIVMLGGWSFLSNDLLDRGDNGVAALRLAGPGPVVIGPPTPPGSAAPSVWALLPDAARVIAVGALLAAIAFAIARARRLGRPVEETLPTPIPASGLVEASAGLYRRARTAAYCGRVARTSARVRLARAVGAARDAPPEVLAADVSRASGVPEARVLAALAGAEPASDDDLLRLIGELNRIASRAGARAGEETTTMRMEGVSQ